MSDIIQRLQNIAEDAMAASGQCMHDVAPAAMRAAVTAVAEALRPAAQHPDTTRCIKARNDLNAALHGDGALIDDLEHAVANACARLSRPVAQHVGDPAAYFVTWPGDPVGMRRCYGADEWEASRKTVEYFGGVARPLVFGDITTPSKQPARTE